jgi:DNA-directed RNA polymerase specialized sigma subunit
MAARTPPPATSKNSITQAGKTIYLNNKELLAEVKRAKKKGQMTDLLARMLMLLCSKYAKKGNFINYSYNEDMQAYAMMMLVRTWNSFDPEKSNNPFAFFTQCIKNSFIQFLNQESRQRKIRDLMLIDQGMNPSHGFVENGSGRTSANIEDDQDFDSMREVAQILTNTKFDVGPIERDSKGDEIEVDIPVESDDNNELLEY